MEGVLERLADPECKKCEGDGWYFQGEPVPMDWTGESGDSAACPCTERNDTPGGEG